MRNESNRPVIEDTDDVAFIAELLSASVPLNNSCELIDPDTDGWANRVDDAVEAIQDTFGVYSEGRRFYVDNENSWHNSLGDVKLYMPMEQFRKVLELQRDAFKEDTERGERVTRILSVVDLL